MKVLLTGANGFVGSHILDLLRTKGIPVRVLLRPSSITTNIQKHLTDIEVVVGSITEPSSLPRAVSGVTHVIHCAGCTKALRSQDFYLANQIGTRHVVEAVNHPPGAVQRMIHISSLAAGGPAVAAAPAREADPPRPVSEYGRSKLAGEQEVGERCQTDYTILRPPAVYGPRDTDFLLLFKTLKRRLAPHFGGGRQPLSLIFVKDLAQAAVACLDHPAANRKTYYVAAPEIVSARQLAAEIARQMNVRAFALTVPAVFLWPVCVGQEIVARWKRRPQILSRLKYPELTASGWVCDAARIRTELGFTAVTGMREGVAETLAWYRAEKWLG